MWTIVRVCSAAPLVSFRLTPPLRKTRMGTQLAAGQAAPVPFVYMAFLHAQLWVENRTTPSQQHVARQSQYTRLG